MTPIKSEKQDLRARFVYAYVQSQSGRREEDEHILSSKETAASILEWQGPKSICLSASGNRGGLGWGRR